MQDVDNDDKFENYNFKKHLKINSYSKDDFRQALLDFQHNVEDQEVVYEKPFNKTAATDVLHDGDFEVATLIFADSSIDAAQEAVLDILPVKEVDNETIELTNQHDTSILTMQSILQAKNDSQDHNQRLLSQVKLLKLLDNCNAPLHFLMI